MLILLIKIICMAQCIVSPLLINDSLQENSQLGHVQLFYGVFRDALNLIKV